MKNNNTFLILFLVFIVISVVNAQQDKTVYYNDLWQETTKDSASFYRLPAKKEGDLYRFKDYYISGQLQMSGLSSSSKNPRWQGKVTWYDKDGKISQQSNYNNNRLDGEFISFLNNKKLIANYNNGYFESGEYNITSSANKFYAVVKNDTITEIVYDKDLNGIRYEKYSVKGGTPFLTKYYGVNGEFIGESTFKNNAVEGVEVFYYYNPMVVQDIRYYSKGQFLGSTFYYENGQVRTKFEQQPEYKNTYYTKTGEMLGDITFKLENGMLIPLDGVEYQFGYSSKESDQIQSIKQYKNGDLIKEEARYNSRNIKSITTYKGTDKDLQISYNEQGEEIARLTYKDYLPFNGTEISRQGKVTYKEGKLLEEIQFYPNTQNMFCKKNQNEEIYYDKKGNIIGELKLSPGEYYGKAISGNRLLMNYNGDITGEEIYKNGNIVEQTYYRKRLFENNKYKTFKKIEYYEFGNYDKTKEINFYSNGQKQSEIEYKNYNKFKGNFYSDKGELIGSYNYLEKDGKLYEFFSESDVIKTIKHETQGQLKLLKRYEYGSNNYYANVHPILIEDTDVNCCSTFYSIEGTVIAKATYKNGKPFSGTMCNASREIYTVSNGKFNGPYKRLDYNLTTVLEEGNYKDNKKEGEFKFYNYNSRIERKETYKNDKLNGKTIFYNENEKEIASLIYKDNLPQDGTLIIDYSYSKKPISEIYKNGQIVERISYDETDGKRISEFKDGKEVKVTAYYKDTDKKRLTYNVKGMYVDDLVITYDKNGNELTRAEFKDGKLKSGTVYLAEQNAYAYNKTKYVILTKQDNLLKVVIKDKDEKTIFKAEEIVEEGDSVSYLKNLNIYLDYLYPSKLY